MTDLDDAQALLTAWEKEIDETIGWDEMNRFRFLTKYGQNDFKVALGLSLPPISPAIHPVQAIESIHKNVIGPMFGGWVPESIYGIALANEGWTYPADFLEGADEAEAKRRIEACGPPSNHPRRVELRIVSCMTQDGPLMGQRMRGWTEFEWMPVDRPAKLGGRVLDALASVVKPKEGTAYDPDMDRDDALRERSKPQQ